MELQSGSSIKRDRQAILRGVYEDNLRTVRRQGPEPAAPAVRPGGPAVRPGEPPVRAGRSRLLLWAIGIFFALGGMLYQGLGLSKPAASDDRGQGLRTVGHVTAGADSGADSVSGGFVGALPAAAGLQPTVTAAGFDSAWADPSVAKLYGLALKTIVLDPGHGGRDPGAIGRQGVMEKDVTLDVARRLSARLARHGYRVLLTRDGDDKLTLRQRIRFANEHDADLFVSLHVNAFPVDSIAPIETYFYGPGSDSRARRLAEQENRNAGYTLAEFNEMTQQLGLEMKIQESKQVAVSIQKGLYRNMRQISENVSDWGAKSGDFMVLLGVEAPSVLAEIASISNPADEAKLNTAEHRERLAAFLEEGVVGYLRQHATANDSIDSIDHATETEE